MHMIILIFLLCSLPLNGQVFNPMPGDPIWQVAAETGIIASAIEGTQERIQQSDFGSGTYVINTSGRYALVENITAPTGAVVISIEADDVYLDLNGFVIDGTNGSTTIINVAENISRLYIGNGKLINSVGYGIRVLAGCVDVILEDLTIEQCLFDGIYLAASAGAAITDVIMRRIETISNGASGIVLSNVNRAVVLDYYSGDDGEFGVSMLNSSSQICIDHFDMFQTGSSSIAVTDNARVVCVKNGCITDAGQDAIIADNVTQLTLQDLSIIKPTAVGMRINGSRVVIEHFDVIRPGSHGIRVASNVSDLCIMHGCVQFPIASGIQFDGFNDNLTIDRIVVEDAGANGFSLGSRCEQFVLRACTAQSCFADGFLFNSLCRHAHIEDCYALTCTGSGFSSTDLGNAILVDCAAIDNREFGFEILSTGTTLASGRNQNILIDSCEAIANYDTGFTIGRTGIVQSSSIKNCTALQNGVLKSGSPGNNFSFYTSKSIITNNHATSPGLVNIELINPISTVELNGENQILSNICSSPPVSGFNFRDSASGPPNIYLGNFAASIAGGATNYSTGASAPIPGVVTATSATAPTNFTYWTNISATNT